MADGTLNTTILKHAASGLSPEEISARIGHVLSPAKVALHVKKLIASSDDYLSIPEQIRLNLQAMRATLGTLQAQYLDKDNAKIRLAYFQAVAKELDRLQKTNDQDYEMYTASVGRAMAAAYDLAMTHAGGRVIGRTEPITLEEWSAIKRESLEIAAAEVAKRQLEE
jgi:hypothetical protein